MARGDGSKDMNGQLKGTLLEVCGNSACRAGKSFDLIECLEREHKGRRLPSLVSAVKTCCHKHLVGCT